MGVLGGGQAQALIVEIGEEWDVTTFTGSYNANREKFDTPENGGVTPWKYVNPYDPFSAQNFAEYIQDSLGLPNLDGSVGPLFLWTLPVYGGNACAWTSSGDPTTICKNLLDWGFDAWSDNVVWAQAEVYFPPGRPRRGGPGPGLDPDEVPGPLPALGAAAAFGFSRKLRKRIKSNANPVPTTHSI